MKLSLFVLCAVMNFHGIGRQLPDVDVV